MKKNKGIKRIQNAFLYSTAGLRHAIVNETAFRQLLCAYIILLFVLYFIKFSILLKIILLFLNTNVLIIELINSAIESLSDKISSEYNEFCKRAKDMASTAVFLTILLTTIIWLYAIIKTTF